ncbi:carbonic anhydrase domain-containing protein [Trichoderma breve]|uniref:Carbonic anhydrase n=1 Tax=Trichoderma breve TaxID=2034170 RepID=A0A9W9E762_9HYPO|nr:carbonic anhydrase domain-containing protein [Trichoderma breve]KAJ4860599.1 carbonic anhydrase domain-containing protein [Trichoderma breve]
MLDIDGLITRNREYAERYHKPIPEFAKFEGVPPSIVIFTCIDFRISATKFLQIKPEGEYVFIIRNAGGRVRSGFSDLVFMETFTQGKLLKEIMIIHHTDCGCAHITDEKLKESLLEKAPGNPDMVNAMYFGAFGSNKSLEEIVLEDISFLKEYPLLRKEVRNAVRGFIFDIYSGLVTEKENGIST